MTAILVGESGLRWETSECVPQGLEPRLLDSHRFGGDTGTLEPLNVEDVGKAPMWVLIASIGLMTASSG